MLLAITDSPSWAQRRMFATATYPPTFRERVERSYNITHWTNLPRGGHLLEWEVPDLLADDMRTFFRPFR